MAAPRKPRTETLSPDDVIIGLIPAIQKIVAWWESRKASIARASDATRETGRITFHVECRWIEAIRRQADLDSLTITDMVNEAFRQHFEGEVNPRYTTCIHEEWASGHGSLAVLQGRKLDRLHPFKQRGAKKRKSRVVAYDAIASTGSPGHGRNGEGSTTAAPGRPCTPLVYPMYTCPMIRPLSGQVGEGRRSAEPVKATAARWLRQP
jgi:hypothetical protein